MFVRFRQTVRRLRLSLVATRREGGKVRHEHVAGLGTMSMPLTVGGRVGLWTSLHQRLGRLANRLDDAMRAEILGAVHARIPMPTMKELDALQLEQARQHEKAWQLRHVQTKGIVETNRALRDGAGKRVAEGEPLLAMADEQLKAARERRERIERGERVRLPGKPPSLKELGITPAHAQYARAIHALAPEQFERFLEFGQRSSDYARRDYARLRRFLRAEAKRFLRAEAKRRRRL